MPDPNPLTPPTVQDRRLKPPGILPKNTQAWVLGGLALLMVIVIAFSGKNAPKDRSSVNSAQMASVADPSAARIAEYQKRIEEQTRKLQMEQAQLARTQQALGLPPSPPMSSSTGENASRYANPSYVAAPTFPPAEHHYVPAETSASENWMAVDRARREYQSLFASNIALSYRKESAEKALDALSAAKQDIPEPRAKISAPEKDADLKRSDGKMYRLFEGTVIETVLTNRLDGYFSGPVNCMVTTNLYSHDGQRLLIPQGSRVLGEVHKVDAFSQQRLAVFFHRLIMPDGYSTSLDKFQGLNQIGETGLRDQVNHHYLQIFGVSIAIGAIAGLAQANGRSGLDVSAADAYREGVASSLSQSSLRILDRYLNVLPTFTIREGHRVKVYLSQDLLLPAYEKHQMPSDL